MKILFVAPFHPWPLDGGGFQRVYHLVASLASRHRVTLVAPPPAPRAASSPGRSPLYELCDRVVEVEASPWPPDGSGRFDPWAPVGDRLRSLASSPFPGLVQRWRSPEFVEALREARRSSRFDAVWVERCFLGELARLAGFERFVVDVDNLESVCLARQLGLAPWYGSKPIHYAELAKLHLYERLLPRRFWRLIVCKEEDRRFFGGGGRGVFVVPNGVQEFPMASPEAELPDRLLFVGSLCYEPNEDAVRYFTGSILPRIARRVPGATLEVVGRGPLPPGLRDGGAGGCSFRVDVPDVEPHFGAASVVVAPIRLGSGTRLKVLEALARGKAVVATSTAAEGLDLVPGVDLEVADDPEAFASACTRLLADPAARRALGSSGRRRVLEKYRWGAVGELAERVLVDP